MKYKILLILSILNIDLISMKEQSITNGLEHQVTLFQTAEKIFLQSFIVEINQIKEFINTQELYLDSDDIDNSLQKVSDLLTDKQIAKIICSKTDKSSIFYELLMMACKHNHYNLVKSLITNGVNIEEEIYEEACKIARKYNIYQPIDKTLIQSTVADWIELWRVVDKLRYSNDNEFFNGSLIEMPILGYFFRK